MKKEKTTIEKLNAIAVKYCKISHNQDNYYVGGGLHESGKFASNRHEDAINDEGKLTQGKFAQMIKKATDVEISTINSLIDFIFPNLEWHHAGKLPKQYGGGMKKTYFINAKEICDFATNFYTYLEKYNLYLEEEKVRLENRKNKEQIKSQFAKENATKIERMAKNKIENFDLFVEIDRECNGKYGWFSASKNFYRMEEFYTGYQFKNEEDLKKYYSL